MNINSHCGSTHLEDLAAAVVRGGYDIGVAFDGDADRCLLVDETGGVIDGDKVLAVCALDMKRRGKLNGNALVATVMSNLGLHEFCRNNGIDLLCTDVGDRNVLERMLEKEPRPAPRFVMDPSVTDFYRFTRDSFSLEGYDPHSFEDKIPVAI